MIKTFSFFSMLVQMWHLITKNNPTSLTMGFSHGIFTTQMSYVINIIYNHFRFFGKRGASILNVINNKVFKPSI
jgi:hypothetical protein